MNLLSYSMEIFLSLKIEGKTLLISGAIQCPWVQQPAGTAKGKREGLGNQGSQDHILMLAQNPGFVITALENDETHL